MQQREATVYGAYVGALLEHDRWLAARAWLVGWLALTSAPCWLMAAWPGLLPFRLRAVVLGVWVVLVAALGLAVVQEAVWRRRVAAASCTLPPWRSGPS